MTNDRSFHPCFNGEVRHRFARIHLPVAAQCNIQCHYCDRKYACVNENRPGVTCAVLSPHQALFYLKEGLIRDPRITVVGIAGPGDPFATPRQTLETLELVKEHFPHLLTCIASNGLALPAYLDDLARLEVSHITITVNAVDSEIGAKIYAWVRDGKSIYRGRAAAELLLQRQLESIRGLKSRGITVKINTIVIPGINDGHVEAVAARMAELGADVLNCIPVFPNPGTVFRSVEQPSDPLISELRRTAGRYLPQMHHCTRCRADAVGLLGESPPPQSMAHLARCAGGALNPDPDRPFIAVASREGFFVNEHLGQASHLLIYGKTEDGFDLIEKRPTPPAGGGLARWMNLAGLLKDCRSVLVASVGKPPREILEQEGVRVIEMEGMIQEALAAVFAGQNIHHFQPRKPSGCGAGCSGNGQGCG